MKKYIAIDIGGTGLKHGIIDERGNIIQRTEIPSEAHKGGKHLISLVKKICKNYIEAHKIEAVGISTAGMVDPTEGKIIYSGKQIPDYIGTQWKQIIQDEFGLRCEVENDVNCAGYSESICGAGQGEKSCACITVGTGIGACMVLDGEIFHGATGSAFEIGYMNMGEGMYQDLASTTALVQRVRAYYPSEEVNGRWIFERAKAGDAVCNEEIDNLLEHLAAGIANICYVANPAVVVLGGGIMEQEEFLAPRLEKALEKKMIPFVRQHTKIGFAKNGNNAGMLGAYYNLRHKMEKE